MMKYSFVLLFFLCLLSSSFTLVPNITHYVYVVSVLYCIGGSLFIVAAVACFVTSLQLGLDQMPDASSSIYAGVWIPDVANLPLRTADSQLPFWVFQLYSLLPPYV